MKKYLLYIFISFICGACSSEKGIPTIMQHDMYLKEKICGLWLNGNKVIQFNPNNTFVEHVYLHNSNKPEFLLYSRIGEYKINHSVLSIKTTGWDFQNCNSITRNLATPYDYKLEINGESMSWNETIELKRSKEDVPANNANNNLRWSIKDSDSNVFGLSCIKKEYFFILEKNIVTNSIKNSLPAEMNKI